MPSNSFNCIIKEVRCTRCCEAIHLPMKSGVSVMKRDPNVEESTIHKYWRRISKRVAKKINPYMFQKSWDTNHKKWIRQDAMFFKCLALVGGYV